MSKQREVDKLMSALMEMQAKLPNKEIEIWTVFDEIEASFLSSPNNLHGSRSWLEGCVCSAPKGPSYFSVISPSCPRGFD